MIQDVDDYIFVRTDEGDMVIYNTERSERLTVSIQILADFIEKLRSS